MGRSKSLESAVRQTQNLYRAWAIVRSNVNTSGQGKFKVEVKEISENPIPYLRRIQDQLQRNSFVFTQQHGVLKKKSSGKKRPIVVSPVANRVVQRALLNILQDDQYPVAALLRDIVKTIRTPTSVGGVPQRGVAYGIRLIRDAMDAGVTHYLRSDLRDFFTRIPKSRVVDFVLTQANDKGFSNLLGQALETELDNTDEIKEYLYLFPLEDIGVPQGSSLSAFAGNVVLRNFDEQMNGRNVTTIRYIDDFVVLGPSEKAVRGAFASGVKILDELGMTAYGPDDGSGKAQIGRISDGFDFLGCSLRHNGVMPSRDARQRLLADVKNALVTGRTAISNFCSSDEPRRAQETYAQTLVTVDRKIRGWGDAFSFSDVRLPFDQMDQQIDRLLQDFVSWGNKKLRSAPGDRRRRALGIALLKDTPTPKSLASQSCPAAP